jgi:hypothetical protein
MIFAEWSPEGIAAVGVALAGFVAAAAAAVVSWRKDRRDGEVTAFGQAKEIIADLRTRVAALEARHDEREKECAALRDAGDALRRRVSHLEALARTCTVPSCPMAGVFKAPPS